MGASLLLVPFSLLHAKMRRLVLPAAAYVFLYSFLPHKELRFIIYVIPVFNVGAALVCQKAWELQSKKTVVGTGLAVVCWGHFFANLLLTGFLLNVSSKNYAGGMAMLRLHERVDAEAHVNVHIGNFAAQTGVSRFLEMNPNWR
jgi:alpha-1,6-mannosyltransferase